MTPAGYIMVGGGDADNDKRIFDKDTYIEFDAPPGYYMDVGDFFVWSNENCNAIVEVTGVYIY
jgi:hypothetical protein